MRGASKRCCAVGATRLSGSSPVAAGAPLEPAAASTSSDRMLTATGVNSLRALAGVCNIIDAV